MDRWMNWVIAILAVAAIIALVSLARGEPGHNDLPPAAIVAVAAR